MAQESGAAKDGISLLVEQHDQVKNAFATLETASGDKRRETFEMIVRMLAVHETAEEEVVYPLVRRELPGGDALADARIAEEDQAKEELKNLEKIGVEAPSFLPKFADFRQAVLSHAEREEQQVFTPLRQKLDADKLESVYKALTAAEAVAPTHPHPSAPSSATGNLVVGPFAAIADRVRDALRSVGSKSH